MKSARKYAFAILRGLIVGVLTLVGQKYLPVNLNFLANSGVVCHAKCKKLTSKIQKNKPPKFKKSAAVLRKNGTVKPKIKVSDCVC